MTTATSGNLFLVFGTSSGWKAGLGALLLKFPNLFFLILGSVVILRIAKLRNFNSRAIIGLWVLSPITIAGSLMQGQIDIVPATMTLITLYFIVKREYYWSMFFLGISAGFKNYSLLFMLPTAIIIGQAQIRKTIQLFLVAVFTYILCLLPFAGNDLIVRLFEWKDDSSLFATSFKLGLQPVYYFVLFYLLLIGALVTFRHKIEDVFYAVCWSSFFVVASIMLTTWWLPQWIIWLVPFGVFLVIENPISKFWFLIFCTSVLINNLISFPDNLDYAMSIFKGSENAISYSGVGGHLSSAIYTVIIVSLLFILVSSFKSVVFTPISDSNYSSITKFFFLRQYQPIFLIPTLLYIILIYMQPLFGVYIIQQTESNVPVGPILQSTPIEQVFDTNGQPFNTLKILFATYARTNNCLVTVDIAPLHSNHKSVKVIEHINASQLKDNSWVKFKFPMIHPVENRYVITITSNTNNPSNAITVWSTSSSVSSLKDYLSFYGKKREGSIAFEVGRILLP
ncbi:hypothetical protein ACOJUR_04385 [Alicyclobacillus tolerans]|uniref:hypothetical protein n=1 Tax=Alicyclobacillus tolerans TaxID=90970 RepID=UPI003B7C9768